MVAVFHPCVVQRGVNHGFAMTSAPQLGMGDNVLQKSVVSSAAQQIWCNDKHASRGDPILIIGDEYIDPRLCQGPLPDALGSLPGLSNCTDL